MNQKIKKNSTRSPLIDQIRGFSVLLMIIFHFSYDLKLFGLVTIDFLKNPYWYLFPRIIVLIFFFCVWVSMKITHTPTIRWRPFGVRLLKLIGLALVISVATYYFFPGRWIYFGTLHSIALCSLLALPFLAYPHISLLVGLALLLPSAILKLDLPWFLLPHPSMDYITPFPWLGAILLGVFAQAMQLEQARLPFANFFTQLLEFAGRHALIIYLIHQPILYSLVWPLQFLPIW